MNTKHNHYYTESPDSKLTKQTIEYRLGGESFQLTTASGVFSKDRVDFGTRLMLDTILKEDIKPSSILDLGCGYGVVGTTLGKLLGAKITMADVNERALMLAKENADRYGVEATDVKSDGFESIEGAFDLIVTNPPVRAGKKAYYPWFDLAKDYLNDGGQFICVLQKKQGAPSAKAKLTESFGNCEMIARDAGYHILRSIK